MARTEHMEFSPDSLLSRVEIIDTEDGLLSAWVPIDLISQDDVPVEAAHVEDLAGSIKDAAKARGTSGQLAPVNIGEIRTEPQFVIIDGFHRVPALQSMKRTVAKALILPDTTWEEVIDLRIGAASTHRSIKFSRSVEWIEQAWKNTPWAETVTATQAFALSFNDKRALPGTNLGLSPDDVTAIRDWTQEKCTRWGMANSSVYKNLYTASLVDPQLVKEARLKNGRPTGILTPSHLEALAAALPHRHDLQQIAAGIAKRMRLTEIETGVISGLLLRLPEEDALEVIESGTWRNLIPKRSKSAQISKSSIGEIKSASDLVEVVFVDELKIASLSLENAILTDRYISPAEFTPSSPLDDAKASLPEELAISHPSLWTDADISGLVGRINNNTEQLAARMSSGLGGDTELAKELIARATDRVVVDMRGGILRRIKFDDSRVIDRLVVECIKDEVEQITARKRPGMDDENDSRAINDYFKTIIQNPVAIRTAKKTLPALSPSDRQAFILTAYYNIDIRAVARVLGETPEAISSTLLRLGQQFSGQAKSSVLDTPRARHSPAAPPAEQGKQVRLPFPAELENAWRLTSREVEVMWHIAQGMTNREVGTLLNLSEETVKSHVRHVLDKTESSNRGEAVASMQREGVFGVFSEG